LKIPKKKQKSEQQESIKQFMEDFAQHLVATAAQNSDNATDLAKYTALAHATRDRIISKWIKTQERYYQKNPKRIYYFSLEYLMGRTLENALLNIDLSNEAEEAVDQLGLSIETLFEQEWDAGLGNGGLGRLAACFLDSMATLELPAYGYGMRYEYGLFRQTIEGQQQKEGADSWLRYGNVWEFIRPQGLELIKFYGRIRTYRDETGREHTEWVETDNVVALLHDVPVPGYKTNTVNTLKLWSAKSPREFDLETFNAGDYIGAIVGKHQSEVISKVLYPNDSFQQGRELRLKQQYFMVSASLQDIISRHQRCGDSLHKLHEKIVIQLNDTHPTIAIPELMRILLDLHDFDWDPAWEVVTKVFAYTNHTILPEALEVWPVPLLAHVLPRHMQIIYEINRRHLDAVKARYPGDTDRLRRMSIIAEDTPKGVRMAHLAIVGSFSLNGVAKLHSQQLRTRIFCDFYDFFPQKFNNKTNGVTPRRWLRKANPGLSKLISSHIGEAWVKDLNQLRKLEPLADDAKFLMQWGDIKAENKRILAAVIHQLTGVEVNLASLFDVQVKRIHEYKRQLLNLLHVITLYNRIRSGQTEGFVPRTVIFAGKAAPGYLRAKQIIHLINSVATKINNDPAVGDLLKVVFLPNYGVSLAEKIFPGSDLSEQISTAGMEASGTGNMKFALNGALTIGTLDGANIEIMEEVGEKNIFIFGLSETEVAALRQQGYAPQDYYKNDMELQQVLDQIRDGFFCPNSPTQFAPLFHSLVNEGDYYCCIADYRAYVDCQERAAQAYKNLQQWHRMALLNVSRMGKFSSDNVIQSYAENIWKVAPCSVRSS